MMETVVKDIRTVLLVDDEPNFLISMGVILQKGGIEPVRTMEDSREVLPYLEKHGAAVVVLDLTMPHISGGELLKKIRTAHPGVNVIILTGHDDLDMAVECMRVGAFDYLVKPVEQSRFLASIGKALELRELQQELSTLKEKMLTERPAHMEAFSSMITVSQKMMALFKYAEAVAVSDQPVLITGETGVGKELMAQAVHDLSGRPGNFIAVTVAGLDDHMFSDTLFGHEKGAYTGAERVREGLIRKAEKGTLFLDEIGDLIESSQVKLLRLLQEKQYYPLGSDTPRRSAAPVVVATNRNLVELQEKGRFRRDLFYRLRFHHIHIPSLRERREDIQPLLDHFLEKAARSMGKKKPTQPAELVTLLQNYSFPGNVRELEGMVYDAVARHESGILSTERFRETIGLLREFELEPDPELSGKPSDGQFFSRSDILPSLKSVEEALVSEAMKRADSNQRIAAEMLGVSRQALNKRLVRGKVKEGK